jgi:hypothetical protein
MEFLPEAELWRRVEAERRARVRELIALGIPPENARSQAMKEFSIYDLVEIDERGWVRVHGLDLPKAARAAQVELKGSRSPQRSAALRSKPSRGR